MGEAGGVACTTGTAGAGGGVTSSPSSSSMSLVPLGASQKGNKHVVNICIYTLWIDLSPLTEHLKTLDLTLNPYIEREQKMYTGTEE